MHKIYRENVRMFKDMNTEYKALNAMPNGNNAVFKLCTSDEIIYIVNQ